MTVTDEYDTSFDATGYSLIHAGDSANVVVKDGTIVASVKKTNTSISLYGVVRVYRGATVAVDNMNIVYNGVDNGGKGAGAVFAVSGVANLTVKDTVVTVANAMGAEIAGGTATFENVTFKNAGDGSWNDICVSATYGGTVTIKSGTYIGATKEGEKFGACVGVLTTGGTLNIEGGSFEGSLMIYAPTSPEAEADSTIVITGGSFNGKAFADMTQADWEEVVDAREGEGEGEAEIVMANGVVTIKIAK